MVGLLVVLIVLHGEGRMSPPTPGNPNNDHACT